MNKEVEGKASHSLVELESLDEERLVTHQNLELYRQQRSNTFNKPIGLCFPKR